EQLEGKRLERGIDGRDLSQNVDAVAVVLEHPFNSPNLAFDPVQPLDERLLVLGIAVHLIAHTLTLSRTLRNRRSRRLLLTTNRLDTAIAAAAMIGFNSPATASGIAATLYANAQNRLLLIVRSVLRARRMASTAARRSPETSVRSDASIATSVPVPIARPRSA